jgi:8-oxo-dGTP pyrophosphatase MutT (NUDIX family)
MAHIRHRETARVLLQASSGRFLLLYSHWSPGSGLEPRWVSPGGGIEPAEPIQPAAARELFEETGLKIEPGQLAQEIAQIEFRQDWANGDYETGLARFFHLQIEQEISISKKFWTADEHRDILDVRWWDISALKQSGETVGPPGLIDLMAELASSR